MHEISLVRNIFSTLEEEYPEKIEQLRGIYLQVGLLSNIQPVLMQSAFKAVLEDAPKYGKTSLHVEVLPILIECTECKKISEIKDYIFKCSCGKPCTNIIQGQEMMISKIEFEEV